MLIDVSITAAASFKCGTLKIEKILHFLFYFSFQDLVSLIHNLFCTLLYKFSIKK